MPNKFFSDARDTNDKIDQIVFISRKDVERITSMSRSWIYQAMAENKFPKNVACSASSVRWVLQEVEDWMKDKVRDRDESCLARAKK